MYDLVYSMNKKEDRSKRMSKVQNGQITSGGRHSSTSDLSQDCSHGGMRILAMRSPQRSFVGDVAAELLSGAPLSKMLICSTCSLSAAFSALKLSILECALLSCWEAMVEVSSERDDIAGSVAFGESRMAAAPSALTSCRALACSSSACEASRAWRTLSSSAC